MQSSWSIGTVSKTLTKKELTSLFNLSTGLSEYYIRTEKPVNQFGEVSDTDKETFEELGDQLLKISFRKRSEAVQDLKTTTRRSIDATLNRVEELVESMGATDYLSLD